MESERAVIVIFSTQCEIMKLTLDRDSEGDL